MNTSLAAIDQAIARGLAYLHEHQYPSGEFCCYIAADDPMQGWCVPESTLFTTTVIAACLLPLAAEQPVAEGLIAKSVAFLEYQMYWGGVWPVFSDLHRWRWIVPYDTDSLAYTSALMQARGRDCPNPSNVPLLLANRTANGLFYTWFVLRLRWQTNRTYWRLAARELRQPLTSFGFWRVNECTRADVDMGINTNILYYLGDVAETQPIIRAMLRVIAEGREDNCDKWYRNPFTIYYLLSRAYARGIDKLAPACQPIIARMLATAQPDGQLGKSILDTALGITTLLNLGYAGPALDSAVAHLLGAQAAPGNWARWLFYYGGPKLLQGWGSEEVTTGFGLEALARYRARRPA